MNPVFLETMNNNQEFISENDPIHRFFLKGLRCRKKFWFFDRVAGSYKTSWARDLLDADSIGTMHQRHKTVCVTTSEYTSVPAAATTRITSKNLLPPGAISSKMFGRS